MTAGVDQVVMLTNAVAPDKLGGLERYVRELSASLVAKGVDVTVLTKRVRSEDPREEVGDDGVRIRRHAVPDKDRRTFALRYPFSVTTGVLHDLRGVGRGAVVHGHFAVPSIPLALRRRPYVYTFHAPVNKEMLSERGDSYALPSATQRSAEWGLRTAERRVVSRASEVVVLSQFMRAELGELSRMTAASCRLVAGGIDTSWFCPGPRERDAWARPADPLLFAARRLTARTGVVELVDAMPAVLAHTPPARLAIAGEGHLRGAVEARVGELGLENKVRLLGRISDRELRNWYRAADLTITPTQELEGFGLSTAESLAVGTPVLVTPVGANPELVRDLHPGLVADGPASEDIARALCALLDESSLLERLRSTARACAHPGWSWDRVAERYLEIYRRSRS
jgi:glycosyltransferase involved in cell wall biosynthesis